MFKFGSIADSVESLVLSGGAGGIWTHESVTTVDLPYRFPANRRTKFGANSNRTRGDRGIDNE